eukprot:3172614-Pleurochrysis_carterae.AAC.3
MDACRVCADALPPRGEHTQPLEQEGKKGLQGEGVGELSAHPALALLPLEHREKGESALPLRQRQLCCGRQRAHAKAAECSEPQSARSKAGSRDCSVAKDIRRADTSARAPSFEPEELTSCTMSPCSWP